MSRSSSTELLTLHAVRLKGMADDGSVADRFALDRPATTEQLLDYEAAGRISWAEFAGSGGWSLTAAGRAENERQLAAELALTAGTDVVRDVHRGFLPLNERLQRACTNWQLKPTAGDALAFNDHADPSWDGRVVDELAALADELRPVVDRLVALLDRFGGYDLRFGAALDRVVAGQTAWVDGSGVDSCHAVWFELHEDLIATLGLTRGTDS